MPAILKRLLSFIASRSHLWFVGKDWKWSCSTFLSGATCFYMNIYFSFPPWPFQCRTFTSTFLWLLPFTLSAHDFDTPRSCDIQERTLRGSRDCYNNITHHLWNSLQCPSMRGTGLNSEPKTSSVCFQFMTTRGQHNSSLTTLFFISSKLREQFKHPSDWRVRQHTKSISSIR